MKRQVEGATGGTTAGTDSSVRQSRATDVGATDVVLMEAVHQLRAYFAGELRQFDVPLRAAGTPFQRAVWEALRTVPYGERVSYAEIARLIGRPSAARAVGRAIGDNPIAIIVPCHRVVGFNGQLTGYAGGLAAKAQLLSLESRVVASAATRR
jgi:methylated-DNA-[protein]-cysteine S-methyltransferase